MIIIGEKVNLRAIEHEDLEFLREMINSEELEKMENGFNLPVSKAQQAIWFQNLLNSKEQGNLIIETKDNEAVGYACILNIDWKNRSAHVGIKILRDNKKSQGIGTDTITSIMKYCFKELQLNRLESFIIDYNEASKNLFIKKCGWTEEGRKRKAVFKNGSYHDLILVSKLKEDYE